MNTMKQWTVALLRALVVAGGLVFGSGVQAAGYAGSLLSAAGDTIALGEELEFTMTAKNTGTLPWQATSQVPGWMYGVWFDDCSWYDEDEEFWTTDGLIWSSVASGATGDGIGTLSLDELPSRPGTYWFWVYAYYPEDTDGNYVAMAGCPKKVTFTILAETNKAPTNITLANATVPEGQPTGTAVGRLAATDPNEGNTFTYTLVPGTGADDNALFSIDGALLRTQAVFDDAVQDSCTVRVRVTDQGGLFFERSFTVMIRDSQETRVVSFDAQGGAVAPASMAVTAGGTYWSLPAPTRAGFAFEGWWTGVGGAGTQVTEGMAVTASADHTLYALWVDVFPSELTLSVGVAFEMTLPEEYAGATVSVKGLPAGLKYNAAAMLISGVPTKAGLFNTVITAAGLAPLSVAITVEGLPVWAQGTFNGDVWLEEDGYVGGSATMTVTAAGKISGKLAFGGKTYPFSAPSYTYGGNGSVGVETTVKIGTSVVDLWLDIAPVEIPERVGAAAQTLSDVYGGMNGGEYGVYLLRNVWKEVGAAALAPFIGYYTATLPGNDEFGSGYLTFTVDKTGKVKTSGKMADGTVVSLSGTLLLDDWGDVGTVLYSAPAGYKGGCLYGWVWFLDDGAGQIITRNSGYYENEEGGLSEWGYPIAWSSLNPQATEAYGDGFFRDLEMNGGFYNKLGSLSAYYQNGLTVAGVDGLPQMLVSVKMTDFDPESEAVKPPKISWWEEATAEPSSYLPNGLLLSLTAAGTGFSAPKSPAPKKMTDAQTGETFYNYEELANPAGLTFALTRATGVFKGSFNVYYDYLSAYDNTTERETWTHLVKKMTYEGVLTPVLEDGWGIGAGNGFFLWKETGWYDTGKDDKYGDPVYKSYPFTWSYNLMLLSE